MKYPPECKRCGLLKTTVENAEVSVCLGIEREHDFPKTKQIGQDFSPPPTKSPATTEHTPWELDPNNIKAGDKHARLHNAISLVYFATESDEGEEFGKARLEVFAAVNELLLKERESLVEKIEGMKKESVPTSITAGDPPIHRLAYNQALDDVIRLVKEV